MIDEMNQKLNEFLLNNFSIIYYYIYDKKIIDRKRKQTLFVFATSNMIQQNKNHTHNLKYNMI